MYRIGDVPPLLLIEPDPGLRRLFTTFLTEEGYDLVLASTLEEAFRLVEVQTFALVLADGWMGHASSDLEQAHALRARVYPVPVAALARLPLPASTKPEAFAFVLLLPFNIDVCLSLIATTLNTPLNVAQQARAQIVPPPHSSHRGGRLASPGGVAYRGRGLCAA